MNTATTETQLEFSFEESINTNNLYFLNGEQLQLLNISSAATISLTDNKSGKTSTLDFSDGRLTFKGEAEGSVIMFLKYCHQYIHSRTSYFYNQLLTYRGIKNNKGEYIADEEYVKGWLPDDVT